VDGIKRLVSPFHRLYWARALFVLGIVLQLTVAASAEQAPASKTIVFVCLHGAANSQVAAAHFNRLALERGLPYTAVSRGIDVVASIPTRIRDGLSLDGLEPVNDVPKPLRPDDAAAAAKVVAFDTVPDDKRGSAEVNYWSDVPVATADYTAARDAIVLHVDSLVLKLAQQTHALEKLEGMVTAVDEQSGQIKVQIDSAVEADFKVQDGRLFNAVHAGEYVEITVATIGGTKTVVGLKKL
jgi:hypothetical protein